MLAIIKYYRTHLCYPKTYNELKQYHKSLCNEYDIDIKIRRTPKNIPTVWDEKFRTLQRNWKKYRKTQYRMK